MLNLLEGGWAVRSQSIGLGKCISASASSVAPDSVPRGLSPTRLMRGDPRVPITTQVLG